MAHNPFKPTPRFIFMKFIKSVLPVFSILFIFSCEQESAFLGRDLLPPGEDISLHIDSSANIIAYTADARPIITSRSESYLLGSLTNPAFGYSESSIVTQFGIASIINFGFDMEVDSLVMILRISDYFGDSLDTHTLRVYELTESIKTDTSYFSDTEIEGRYNPQEIGVTQFSPKDSVIRMHITDPDFLTRFLIADDSTFANNTKFKEQFKGLYLTVDNKAESEGSFVNINFQSEVSRMLLYYNSTVEPDSVSRVFAMIFRGDVATFSVFKNDYENFPPSVNLNNPAHTDTLLFLTPMAGLNINLLFPELEEWREKKGISIIKAELTAAVEDGAFNWNNNKWFPQNLLLFYLDENNNYNQISDYKINSTTFGGRFLPQENAYKFSIGHHLQSYIEGKVENFELVIIPDNSNTIPNRVILKSHLSSAPGRMKLKIIYTELN